MLARCTHCESTFVTSQFGRQRCPKCGVDVVVEDHMSETAQQPSVPPPPPSEQPAELTPWERRHELGTLPALGTTISAVLSRPGPFFRRIRYDSDDGALLYFAIVALVPYIIAQFVSFLGSSPEQVRKAYQQIKDSGALEQLPAFGSLMDKVAHMSEVAMKPQVFAGTLAMSVIFMILGLFAVAGVVHAILSLFKKAGGGWTATFKATVYSATPLLFLVVPACGGLIGATWATGIQIYAISRAHRITVGWATVGVLGLHAVFLTCCCGVGILAIAAAQAH